MKSESIEVGRHLAAFRDRPAGVMDAESLARRRARVVARMQEVLAEPRVRPLSWLGPGWLGWTAAFVLGGAAVLFVGLRMDRSVPENKTLRQVHLQGPVLCRHGTKPGSWAHCDSRALASGDVLRTLERARAKLETQAGVRLELAGASELDLTSIEPGRGYRRVSLNLGQLDVRVPHLTRGDAFSVVTPQATVTVHGTAFTVEVSRVPDGASRTCVRVSEGAVVVRHTSGEDTVVPGESWGCREAIARDAAPAPPARAPEPSSTSPARVARRNQGTDSNTRASTLGAEAALLQKALGAERDGDLATAEHWLVTLLRSYPESVVAPDARAALKRVRACQ
ncbi:MAG: FecR domain-containing protein [Polyangiaceae bacterium]|nr:FecR domain-containing protein [Polyangiaceae bacterium]